MTKVANTTLRSVFSMEEGDDGKEEGQRRQMGRGEGAGKEADLIGQAEVPENLIGQAKSSNGFDQLPGRHRKTPSEEVVTHHLDELWHLGPGESRD